ncbi:MAG: phospho-sugar mutase [Bacteroidetes bacterium]|nr:phospho-sugar mutase [Bacteroidota bacterium]
MEKIDPAIIAKANIWLEGNYDADTKAQVSNLLNKDHKELIESFYTDLEFGTGGLRGIMGVGTNRMNKYTVGMATQGFANFLIKNFPSEKKIKVAIAYDCRNNSKYFAQISAEVLSGNNIEAYLFNELQPTPLLSYAVRKLNCQGGIVITASHNPKEYNGYKVYGPDGGQLISPQDKQVIDEVRSIKSVDDIKFERVEKNIISIPDSIIESYLEEISSLSLSPNIIAKHKNLKIVFTPIHGTTYKIAPLAFKKFGFNNIINIPEQDITDGNFPTVNYPNPEEAAALKMAMDKAKSVDAEIVMATDPDGDRVGIAVKDLKGELIPLNGNQTASILIFYLLEQWKQKNKIKGKEFIVKTIVTTELLTKIANVYNVECYDVLTGFKYIAEIIRNLEGNKQFIGGGEESYGYLIGDLTRDKDAVISCCFIAEAAAWAKEYNKSLFELLVEIYVLFGFYKEKLISITKKGKEGLEEIQKMMNDVRNNPPSSINNSEVVLIKDYKLSIEKDIKSGTEKVINLPKSNVIQIFLEDGTKITMRPSGTEPKIKFYFGVFGKLNNKSDFEKVDKELDSKIENVIKSLNI